MKSLRNDKKTEYLFCVLACALCIYVLLPIFQVAAYNRPVRDDYSYGLYAYQVVSKGGGALELIRAVRDNVVRCYMTISGLYTSAVALSLHPGVWGEKTYALSTYVIVAVVYFYIFWSMYIINKHYIRRSVLFVAAASATLETVLVLWLPGPREGLYWYNGAMNYMPYAFMNFTNLMLILEADDNWPRRKGKVMLGLSLVLSFLISGGNQVTSFANILFLLFVTIRMVYKKKPQFALPLVMACIGFVIMLLSPGTRSRQEQFGNESVLATIIATLRYVHKNAADWMSLKWIISLVMITPVAMEIAVKNTERFSGRFPLLQILLCGMVLCGMLCVPYYPMGWFGSGRIINVIWMTFMVLSWYLYVLIWGCLVRNRYVNMERIAGKNNLLVSGLLVLVCIFASYAVFDGEMSNSMLAKHEMASGEIAGYAQEMDERIELFKDDSLTEVGVNPIENQPILLCGKELSTDPDEWPNSSMGKWYNKKIYLISPEE